MEIGVLSLQGAFAEHRQMLGKLGVESFEIRRRNDIARPVDGLVLPGGESTVMGKLLRELDLFSPLLDMIQGGLPVFGTCAGLLLLAKTVSQDGTVCFGTMDIAARRNAYGRQLDSFFTEAAFAGLGIVPMTFIRAPYIESVSGSAVALAMVDGRIVAARQGRQLVTAFHPELGSDLSILRYFLEQIVPGRA